MPKRAATARRRLGKGVRWRIKRRTEGGKECSEEEYKEAEAMVPLWLWLLGCRWNVERWHAEREWRSGGPGWRHGPRASCRVIVGSSYSYAFVNHAEPLNTKFTCPRPFRCRPRLASFPISVYIPIFSRPSLSRRLPLHALYRPRETGQPPPPQFSLY